MFRGKREIRERRATKESQRAQHAATPRPGTVTIIIIDHHQWAWNFPTMTIGAGGGGGGDGGHQRTQKQPASADRFPPVVG